MRMPKEKIIKEFYSRKIGKNEICRKYNIFNLAFLENKI